MTPTETWSILAAWGFVGILIAGIEREVTGRWSPVGLFWPLIVAIASIAAVGWLLAWIGRVPARLYVRLGRRRRQAERIARAEVHRG